MMHKLLIFSLLFVLLINKSKQTNDDNLAIHDVDNVPALFYSRNHELSSNFEYNIGEPLSTDELNAILVKLYPRSESKVAIVLLNKLNDQNIRFNNAKKNLDMKKVVYVPSISGSYDKISDYLHNSKVEIELYQIDDDKYEDALEKFINLKKKFDSVILTGIRSFHKRSARATSTLTESNTTNILVFGSQCAASFSKIEAINQTGLTISSNRTLLNITTKTFSCDNNQTAVLTLNLQAPAKLDDEYLTQITISYTRQARNWMIKYNETVAVTNKQTYRLKLLSLPYNSETPVTYSYACTEAKFQLAIVNSTASVETKPIRYFIYMSRLQIQPFDVKQNNSEYKFGVVNYCDGFFTNGIWMAIASSLLLGIILAFGIYALLSVNTMDRFDDPKGKPLVINAEKN